jgi:adenylate cyclase
MPDVKMSDKEVAAEKVWRSYLTTGYPPPDVKMKWFEKKFLRPIIKRLPHDPRCRVCYYPFEGAGGRMAKVFLGLDRAKMNPQMCNVCETFAADHQGGAEIELSMLFADVRGSTTLAEGMSPRAFSQLIDRFYSATTHVLYRANAWVEKIIGDEVTGLFFPGFSGQEHAKVAVQSAMDILDATGHADEDGPWIPVGVGVHTGMAYVGAVTTEGGVVDITALGDAVNTAARLASLAGSGEIVISEEVRQATGIDTQGLTSRSETLKGRSQPSQLWVIPSGTSLLV